MSKLRAQNTISGKEGRLFLDGEEMAHLKNIEATIEKNKAAIPIMGRRMEGHKTTGASGTGNTTFYKVTSRFIKIMLEYIKNGQDLYFTMQVVIDDPSSDRGVERVTLYDVNFDSVKVAGLDVEAEALEEELPFTFEDIDLDNALNDTF
ncbi:phage tail tube protein [Alkalihalobacillus trypoxylicola]|uniref:Phage portal protein n=1 Tax=Alkalihalobacillus trypoxylicola TaxID=519424 RepID=A0A162EWC9_9BACI|nr:phage tail tube protein [Alkalihalobacillus trypoxylicola]KYG33894.1 phage portal protein [Alkalihalobacillus trypoxylicola]